MIKQSHTNERADVDFAARNHPDRHPAARVGVEAAARATLMTQQATFLLSMLEDHEYVALRVHVEVPAGAGGGPSSAGGEVVLNRVHLAGTLSTHRTHPTFLRSSTRLSLDAAASKLLTANAVSNCINHHVHTEVRKFSTTQANRPHPMSGQDDSSMWR